MQPNRSHWEVRVGQAVFFGLMGLVVVAILFKGPWPSDFVYLLVRWPLWLVVLFGLPLLAVRVWTWHRHGPYGR